MTDKKIKLEFMPGCFDSFDGTQEELDKLKADIEAMFESGELEANASMIEFEEIDEEFGADDDFMSSFSGGRNLH